MSFLERGSMRKIPEELETGRDKEIISRNRAKGKSKSFKMT